MDGRDVEPRGRLLARELACVLARRLTLCSFPEIAMAGQTVDLPDIPEGYELGRKGTD